MLDLNVVVVVRGGGDRGRRVYVSKLNESFASWAATWIESATNRLVVAYEKFVSGLKWESAGCSVNISYPYDD